MHRVRVLTRRFTIQADRNLVDVAWKLSDYRFHGQKTFRRSVNHTMILPVQRHLIVLLIVKGSSYMLRRCPPSGLVIIASDTESTNGVDHTVCFSVSFDTASAMQSFCTQLCCSHITALLGSSPSNTFLTPN